MATAAYELSGREETYLSNYAARVLPILREPDTLDVVVNADGRMWVNRLGGGFECQTQKFSPSTSDLLLRGVATVRGLPLDDEHPILETIFPLTGDRIEGLVPPVVAAPVWAIRTRPKQIFTLDQLQKSGVLSDGNDPLNKHQHVDTFIDVARVARSHVEVIRLAAQYRRNILIVGPTGSGKTSMLSGIVHDWLTQTPNDRVVIIEDTPEVQCSLPNHVQLLSTAHVPLSALLVASLRLIPKRIIVGEIRSSKPARVVLEAWNTGHTGGLVTIHANNALQGLRKFESLVGGARVIARERIAEAVSVVVFIDAEASMAAGRKVREVLLMTGFNARKQDYELLPL